MKVLVCGGRDFTDGALVNMALERFVECCGPIKTLIHGGAAGVDTLAAEWAKRTMVARIHEYRANWRKYGKRAGPLRNQKMLDEGKPDLVIAFPGGRGTADMCHRAFGVVPIWRVDRHGWPPDHLWKYRATPSEGNQ